MNTFAFDESSILLLSFIDREKCFLIVGIFAFNYFLFIYDFFYYKVNQFYLVEFFKIKRDAKIFQ